jgi:hypothetical protein
MKKACKYKIGDKVDFRRVTWPSCNTDYIRGALIIGVIEWEVVPGVENFVITFPFFSQPLSSQDKTGGVRFYYKVQLPNHEYSISSRDQDPTSECVAQDLISKSKDRYSIEELLTHPFSAFRLTGEFLRRKNK